MELNPNHPVTKEVRDSWHKYLAILMLKTGNHHLVITPADVDDFLHSGFGAVTVKDGEQGDGNLHFRLVSMSEGERLAREEGGLPA